MSTYHSKLDNQSDVLPSPYSLDQELPSYHKIASLSSNMMYLNQAPAAYSELYPGTSPFPGSLVENTYTRSKNEAPPTCEYVTMHSPSGQLNVTSDSHIITKTSFETLDSEQNYHCQGLSLSLGKQIPSSVQEYQYTHPGTTSLLSSHVSDSGDSQRKDLSSVEYLSFDLAGGIQNTVKIGAFYDPRCLVSPKEMHSGPQLVEQSGLAFTVVYSTYLKAAQLLLDEMINVHEALKKPKLKKHNLGSDGVNEIDMKSCSTLPSNSGVASETQNSTANASCELPSTERQDLERKMAKFLSMLDEVDRRYKQYYQHMQMMISSFEMVAGHGAAKPYTALALQTISRHFRCLRDAINEHIRATQIKLGELDASTNSQGAFPRLRYVDQQLRQQRAFQQYGAMRHSWRPQRGLPERSVSILRAWLFEHFLHPYPKDSEKIMLARQTGLSRGQVANWFINARVRLWKPMVEDMYKEEFGNSDMDLKSSPECGSKAAEEKSESSQERGEELQGNVISTASNSRHAGLLSEPKHKFICNVDMKGCTARLGFHSGTLEDDNIDFSFIKLQQGDQRANIPDHHVCGDKVLSNCTVDMNVSVAAAMDVDSKYISALRDFSVGNQVSLGLGLPSSQESLLLLSDGMQLKEKEKNASCAGLDQAEYHYVDPVNKQHRFSNAHVLPDFIA